MKLGYMTNAFGPLVGEGGGVTSIKDIRYLTLCDDWRNSSVSGCGVYRSENAGMSSANVVRIHMAGNLRFLEEGSSAPS